MKEIISFDLFSLSEEKGTAGQNAVYLFKFKYCVADVEESTSLCNDLRYLFSSITWGYEVVADLSQLDVYGNRGNFMKIASIFTVIQNENVKYCKIIMPSSVPRILSGILTGMISAILAGTSIPYSISTSSESSQRPEEESHTSRHVS